MSDTFDLTRTLDHARRDTLHTVGGSTIVSRLESRRKQLQALDAGVGNHRRWISVRLAKISVQCSEVLGNTNPHQSHTNPKTQAAQFGHQRLRTAAITRGNLGTEHFAVVWMEPRQCCLVFPGISDQPNSEYRPGRWRAGSPTGQINVDRNERAAKLRMVDQVGTVTAAVANWRV